MHNKKLKDLTVFLNLSGLLLIIIGTFIYGFLFLQSIFITITSTIDPNFNENILDFARKYNIPLFFLSISLLFLGLIFYIVEVVIYWKFKNLRDLSKKFDHLNGRILYFSIIFLVAIFTIAYSFAFSLESARNQATSEVLSEANQTLNKKGFILVNDESYRFLNEANLFSSCNNKNEKNLILVKEIETKKFKTIYIECSQRNKHTSNLDKWSIGISEQKDNILDCSLKENTLKCWKGIDKENYDENND